MRHGPFLVGFGLACSLAGCGGKSTETREESARGGASDPGGDAGRGGTADGGRGGSSTPQAGSGAAGTGGRGNRNCLGVTVACDAEPPVCDDGLVPSVVDGCWGPCVPATECEYLTDCTSCGDATCVTSRTVDIAYWCVDLPAACEVGRACDCPGICPDYSDDACTEVPGGVICDCFAC